MNNAPGNINMQTPNLQYTKFTLIDTQDIAPGAIQIISDLLDTLEEKLAEARREQYSQDNSIANKINKNQNPRVIMNLDNYNIDGYDNLEAKFKRISTLFGAVYTDRHLLVNAESFVQEINEMVDNIHSSWTMAGAIPVAKESAPPPIVVITDSTKAAASTQAKIPETTRHKKGPAIMAFGVEDLAFAIADKEKPTYNDRQYDIRTAFGVEGFRLNTSAILGSNDKAYLKNTMARTDLKIGEHNIDIYAASAAGIGYNADNRNEDRVAIAEGKSLGNNIGLIGVIDGVGGSDKGENFANILARHITGERRLEDLVKEGLNNGSISSGSAACASVLYLSPTSSGSIEIKETFAGDTRVYVFNNTGQITYASEVETLAALRQRLNPNGKPDPYTENTHHIVTNYINGYMEQSYGFNPPRTLETNAGDTVVVLSDGVDDNFTPKELEYLFKEANFDPEEFINVVSEAIKERLENKSKSRTFARPAKNDNVSMVAFKIPS